MRLGLRPSTVVYKVIRVALRTLREMRQSRTMTLKQVSEATRISIPHLSEIERGIRRPHRAQLVALSDHYGVDPDGWVDLLVQDDLTATETILRSADNVFRAQAREQLGV